MCGSLYACLDVATPLDNPDVRTSDCCDLPTRVAVAPETCYLHPGLQVHMPAFLGAFPVLAEACPPACLDV
jgi:hypothetical protein